MNFLRNHWADIGAVLAAAVLVFVFSTYAGMDRYEIIVWLSLCSLFFHQLEEYRIVGTFPGMINRVLYKSDMPDRYPLNRNTALYVNVFVGWAFYLLAALFAEKAVWLGIATMMVSIGNIVGHTTLFNIKGKTLYNAGLATSWLFFAPIAWWFFATIQAMHIVTPKDYYIGVPLGLILNIVGVVKLIDWMKNRNTPYIFPRRCLLPADRSAFKAISSTLNKA